MVIDKILKEWSSALKFYETKKVCLIFRKGGIGEKVFNETEDFFGFFPTFEHESFENVKKEFRNRKYITNEKGEYTGVGELKYFGKIFSDYTIDSSDKLELLNDFHIWDNSYLIDRFNFRPKSPLKCYVLDVYKIKYPKKIEYNIDEAKGCTSWFRLNNEISVHGFDKINDDFYVKKALKILNSFKEV